MQSKPITLRTSKHREIVLVTRDVEHVVEELSGGEGICTVFTPHTTAALSINENADPDVRSDLTRALEALVPDVRFDHGEGNSDAHLLSSIIGVSIQVPFRHGKLLLGRWQGIYFFEFDGPRTREVIVYV